MGTIINKNDSMATIQSKLNRGGDITFTKGVYKITRQLVISKNTNIDLNGATLQRKASIQSIFINKANANSTLYNADGNITIKNGTLEGMGGYSYDNLVTFFHSHDIIINKCIFKDILCHGIEFNSSSNCSVIDCDFTGYNLKDADNAYKEMIQIDFAGYSAFVLNGTSKTAKCYDGTHCTKINILNCKFDRSASRDYPYACIGAHSQLYNCGNLKHTNICIENNVFHCKINSEIIQACISITNMENVIIRKNIFDCNRVARIYSKNYSYAKAGSKKTAAEGDGICSNIQIIDNDILKCKKNSEAFQQYNKSSTTTDHKNIEKKNNRYNK